MHIAPAQKKLIRHVRNIAIVAALAIVLSVPPFVNFFAGISYAGSLTNYGVTINNSQADATGVTYSFNLTTSATTSIKQIDIQVCTTPSGTCNAPSGFSSGTPTLSTDNIAGSGRTVSAPSANAFRVVVTTPSTQSTQAVFLAFTGVTNPSTTDTTYYVRTTTYSDTGSTIIDGPNSAAFAILTTGSVAVTASVDPNFTFTVAGVASSGTVNSATTTVTTTASTIPFGTLTVATPAIAAHDLTITTNASNGYTITASHSATAQSGFPPLVYGTSDNIDSFSGTNASPASWSSPAGSSANTNTGYFGYTTEDTTLCTGTASRFSSNLWAGSTTTGQEVACSTTGVSSQTIRVGWQTEVNSLQPAGTYAGTVILVATPTY